MREYFFPFPKWQVFSSSTPGAALRMSRTAQLDRAM
jgi:hypothetical protein